MTITKTKLDRTLRLIELAKTAGIGIGCRGRNRHYWWRSNGQMVTEVEFIGTNAEFEAEIKRLVAASK